MVVGFGGMECGVCLMSDRYIVGCTLRVGRFPRSAASSPSGHFVFSLCYNNIHVFESHHLTG